MCLDEEICLSPSLRYKTNLLVCPVAERLEKLEVPFVSAIGFDPSVIPGKYAGFLLCEKPAELEKIADALFGERSKDQLQ